MRSFPHSPPTSLTVKVTEGSRDWHGTGKNHAVKSYGGEKTLTTLALTSNAGEQAFVTERIRAL